METSSKPFRKVTQEAQVRLKEEPFDEAHDHAHHAAVVKNCRGIVQDENLKLDMQALLIAAWWHDYKRDNEEENDKILTQTMKNAGFDEEFTNIVLNIKNSHSFGNGQETLEQEVLFDADKLEYASVSRMKKVEEAVKTGKMSQDIQNRYRKAFLERLPTVLSTLHFESSRVEIRRRLEEVKEYATNNPLWVGLDTL